MSGLRFCDIPAIISGVYGEKTSYEIEGGLYHFIARSEDRQAIFQFARFSRCMSLGPPDCSHFIQIKNKNSVFVYLGGGKAESFVGANGEAPAEI